MKTLKPKWIIKTPQNRLYKLSIPVIGLTGGIATGKSTVAELFRKEGIAVIDADKLVKSIYQKKDAINFIKENFPEAFIDGIIHFSTLRKIAFSSEDSKKSIENFIYSFMPEAFLETLATFDKPNLIVYDVPLLFEKHLHLLVDVSVCVYAKFETQKHRLMQRDKISEDLALKILSHQMSIEDKKKIADLIIENTGDVEQLTSNFTKLVSQLFDDT